MRLRESFVGARFGGSGRGRGIASHHVAHREKHAQHYHHNQKHADELAVSQYQFKFAFVVLRQVRLAFQFLLPCQIIQSLAQRREYIDGQGEDNRCVLVGADLDQCLQIAKRERGGLFLNHFGGHA